MIPSSSSPATRRIPPRTTWPNWRFGWKRSRRRYRGVSTAGREQSTVLSSVRFLRQPTSRTGPCWKRFALHRRILSKGLWWISPFRHLDITLSNCQASAQDGNKRSSPCEPLASIRPLQWVVFLPKTQLLKKGSLNSYRT